MSHYSELYGKLQDVSILTDDKLCTHMYDNSITAAYNPVVVVNLPNGESYDIAFVQNAIERDKINNPENYV